MKKPSACRGREGCRSIRRGLELQEERGLRCSVKTCWKPVHGFTQYCPYHYGKRNATGSAMSKGGIWKRDIEPHRAAAQEFIENHADHESIRNATKWLTDLVLASQRHVRPWSHTSTNPMHRYHAWVSRLYKRDTFGEQLLPILVALFIYRIVDNRKAPPGNDPDYDRWFNKQICNRLLKAAKNPGPAKGRLPQPKNSPWKRRDYIWANGQNPANSVCAIFVTKVLHAVGLIASRIAKQIVAEHNLPVERLVKGSRQPFETKLATERGPAR